jgi:hypothetical protein
VSVHNAGLIVGHHDGYQSCGCTLGTGCSFLPTDQLTGTGEVVSGRDTYAKKGQSISSVSTVKLTSHDNYCEASDDTYLVQQSGTAEGGGTDYVVLEDEDDPGIDDFYSMRMVTFSGQSCPCAGVKGVTTHYTHADDTLQFGNTTCGAPVTNACTYTIAAVSNPGPCRDIDWTTIAAGGQGKWKHTCAHLGASFGTGAAHSSDSLTIQDTECSVILNESSMGASTSGSGCNGQNEIAGFLAYRRIPNTGTAYGSVELNNFDVKVHVNADQAESTCANPIAALAATGDSDTEEIVWRNSAAQISNTGDLDENVAAITADSSHPVDLVVENVSVDVTTAPGYSGTKSTLVSAPRSTLENLTLQTSP